MVNFFTTLPSFSMLESLKNLWESTGFMTSLTPIWQNLIMIGIACVLIYLAVAKEFEPNLLLAIGFGMFIINIPGAYSILYGTLGYKASFVGTPEQLEALKALGFVNEAGQYLTANGEVISGTVKELAKLLGVTLQNGMSATAQYNAVHTAIEQVVNGYQSQIAGNTLFEGVNLVKGLNLTHEVVADQGLFFYLYKGVEWVIYPPLIFLGIGAMTDFGPLIANPKSLLMGAAAQLGIFITFIIAINIGFTGEEAAVIQK